MIFRVTIGQIVWVSVPFLQWYRWTLALVVSLFSWPVPRNSTARWETARDSALSKSPRRPVNSRKSQSTFDTSVRNRHGTTLRTFANAISPFGKVKSSGCVRKWYSSSLLRSVGVDNRYCKRTKVSSKRSTNLREGNARIHPSLIWENRDFERWFPIDATVSEHQWKSHETRLAFVPISRNLGNVWKTDGTCS